MKFKKAFLLIDTQARMSLKAEATKLYLSYVWWVLEPLLYVLVYYVVFQFLLARGQENFVLFLMCGKVPYLWLSKSITMASNSLLMNKGLIAATDLPKIIFPYISIQEVLYKQWLVFLILFAIAIYYGSLPNPLWLWLIPVIITNYVILLFLSLLAAVLVTYVQDFRILINMGLIFLMFASGIFWDLHDIQNEYWRDLVMTLNPLAFIIDSYRQIIMEGEMYNLNHLSALFLIFTIAVGSVHLMFNRINFSLTRQVLQS
jgi:lipopolysaccharide transport system permease protein